MSEDRTVKKVRPGTIELDPEDSLLIVNCVIESTVLQNGEPVSRERKAVTKSVPVSVPITDNDISQQAEEVVRSCKYITKSQLQLVEQRLRELYERAVGVRDLQEDIQPGDDEEATMENLEVYLEMLYEGQDDMSEKIKGTYMILQLCHDVGNLKTLIQDHTLMGALSRVLNDEYRKSMELTYNIMRIFLAFSNFIEMHDILANYRVGSLTMKVAEMELKKAELREEERKKKQAAEDDDGTNNNNNNMDIPRTSKLSKREESNSSNNSNNGATAKALAKKQDKLMFVCFYVLLNLATDVNSERKMTKKKLTEQLVILLDRTSYDLLLLVVTFLKKLSIYEENMAEMRPTECTSKLVRFLTCSHDRLIDLTLRLLFNLSFDPTMREQMVRNSCIPKLVELLKKPPYRARVLRLLYHLSLDDRCKSMFTYTEAIPLVKELVINFPRNMLTMELAALAINLTWNGRNAELICQKGGLKRLMERMVDKKDPLLMKVIRNISQWTLNTQSELNDPAHEYRFRSLWPPHIKSLVSLILETENNDLLVEVIGTLANLTQLDLPMGTDWINVIEDYDLLSLCKRLLVLGMAQNDIVLEVVMLVGAFVMDPLAAREMAHQNIIRSLQEVWADKSDDPEIVLQILYTFYRLLKHQEPRDIMLYVEYKDKKSGVQQTRTVLNIIDALNHRSPEIRHMADMCLEVIMEYDRDDKGGFQDLGSTIRKKRYLAHNREWCEITEQEEQMRAKEGYSNNSYDTPPRSTPGSEQGVNWASHVIHNERLAMDMSDLNFSASMQYGMALNSARGPMDDEEDDDDPHSWEKGER